MLGIGGTEGLDAFPSLQDWYLFSTTYAGAHAEGKELFSPRGSCHTDLGFRQDTKPSDTRQAPTRGGLCSLRFLLFNPDWLFLFRRFPLLRPPPQGMCNQAG